MRATPDELLLAQKLVNDLDKARPEVVVDVAVLEVNKNLMRQIGIQLPQTASVTLTTPTDSYFDLDDHDHDHRKHHDQPI